MIQEIKKYTRWVTYARRRLLFYFLISCQLARWATSSELKELPAEVLERAVPLV